MVKLEQIGNDWVVSVLRRSGWTVAYSTKDKEAADLFYNQIKDTETVVL